MHRSSMQNIEDAAPSHGAADDMPSPWSETPKFDTERFIVTPLSPSTAGQLFIVLLEDEQLAEQVTWLEDKSADSVRREGRRLKQQCAVGAMLTWGVVERTERRLVGQILVKCDVESIDVEVLCASPFWYQGVTDEVGEPLRSWLEANTDVLVGAAVRH
jgi:hypothetical protein